MILEGLLQILVAYFHVAPVPDWESTASFQLLATPPLYLFPAQTVFSVLAAGLKTRPIKRFHKQLAFY